MINGIRHDSDTLHFCCSLVPLLCCSSVQRRQDKNMVGGAGVRGCKAAGYPSEAREKIFKLALAVYRCVIA